MSKLLINEPPIQLLPTLAIKVGLSKAILLQQVHYWCENPKMGAVRDGKRWIRNTAEEWQKDNFPFWSLKTVKRTIAALEKDGLLLSRDDLNKSGYDRTKWYTINHEALNNDALSSSDEPELDDPIDPNWADAEGQNDPMERDNVTRSLSETTTETTTETTLPASQAQPNMLQDELAALNGATPTNSPGTEEKKQRKPRSNATPVAPGVMSSSSHKEMFAALAAMCVLDPKLKAGQINRTAKALRDAGYGVTDLEKYRAWWKSQDWRGQRGDPPVLGLIESQILQAVQWSPQPAHPQPVQAAKPKGYDLSTLRGWHKQYCYEEWHEHIAADLGRLPFAQGAFKEWYDNEGSIPDGELAGWYDWWLNRNKETSDV